MTFYADCCAFPFNQRYVLKQEVPPSPESLPDLVVCSSVPPLDEFKLEDIIDRHRWFTAMTLDLCAKETTFIYGLQLPPVQTRGGLGIDDKDIRKLAASGIHLMSLAYELPTCYGGGFATPDEPLTRWGKHLLDNMAEAGMILDLAHVGHQTCRDAMEHIYKHGLPLKIVASHVGCYDLKPGPKETEEDVGPKHLRNLPDDILKQIAWHGGVIGLFTVGWMLGPEKEDGTPRPFLRHFDHLVKLLGPDAKRTIAIGSDGLYNKIDKAEKALRFDVMKAMLDPRNNFKPRLIDEPEIFEGGGRMQAIRAQLINNGYGYGLADAVCGKNLARFFLKNPPKGA